MKNLNKLMMSYLLAISILNLSGCAGGNSNNNLITGSHTKLQEFEDTADPKGYLGVGAYSAIIDANNKFPNLMLDPLAPSKATEAVDSGISVISSGEINQAKITLDSNRFEEDFAMGTNVSFDSGKDIWDKLIGSSKISTELQNSIFSINSKQTLNFFIYETSWKNVQYIPSNVDILKNYAQTGSSPERWFIDTGDKFLSIVNGSKSVLLVLSLQFDSEEMKSNFQQKYNLTQELLSTTTQLSQSLTKAINEKQFHFEMKTYAEYQGTVLKGSHIEFNIPSLSCSFEQSNLSQCVDALSNLSNTATATMNALDYVYGVPPTDTLKVGNSIKSIYSNYPLQVSLPASSLKLLNNAYDALIKKIKTRFDAARKIYDTQQELKISFRQMNNIDEYNYIKKKFSNEKQIEDSLDKYASNARIHCANGNAFSIRMSKLGANDPLLKESLEVSEKCQNELFDNVLKSSDLNGWAEAISGRYFMLNPIQADGEIGSYVFYEWNNPYDASTQALFNRLYCINKDPLNFTCVDVFGNSASGTVNSDGGIALAISLPYYPNANLMFDPTASIFVEGNEQNMQLVSQNKDSDIASLKSHALIDRAGNLKSRFYLDPLLRKTTFNFTKVK